MFARLDRDLGEAAQAHYLTPDVAPCAVAMQIDQVSITPVPGGDGSALSCEFEPGDGIGGSESYIGDAGSARECMQMVASQQPSANGATYCNQDDCTRCYAEFGMTGNNGNAAYQTCLMTGAGAPSPPPAVRPSGGFGVSGCSWGVGDGVGGTEQSVGEAATAAACATMVKNLQPTANGATFSANGGTDQGGDGACYAEFGMTGPNDSTSWQTCLFIPGFCNYVVGDGTGGSEEYVADVPTAAECVNAVQEFHPDANGATYSNTGGTQCYAEFGMTGPNDSTAWQTCIFPGDMSLCTYEVGDGDGDSEERVGDANSEMECVSMVRQMRPDANGATYSAPGTGTSCYAEFGMTESNGNSAWQTCMFASSSTAVVAGCSFAPGDGTGGTESSVGDAADAQACAALVVEQEPTANGATYSNTGGTECYAEFGQTGNNDSGSWQNCMFTAGATAASCVYSPGDGVGGTEAGVGDAPTAADCAAMVMREQPTANGATYSNTGGTECYAEFGMTGPNDSTSWQTCMFSGGSVEGPPPPPDLGTGCEWTTGDGAGGTEEGLGEAPTPQACAELVQQTRPEANGATYRQGGTACYAEFAMSGSVESDTWQTCMFAAATDVSCAFAEGDGTGGTEEYLGETDTASECVTLVHSTRPEANGVTYSNGDGSACYAEFGATDSTGAPSAWQTCILVEGGGDIASCAEQFTDVFSSIQSTCCVRATDCDHGSPSTCNSRCGDLVLDFWRRCESAVQESFGEALHDQLDAFASTCERTTGAGSSTCPQELLFAAAATCAGVGTDRGFCASPCGSLLAPLTRVCDPSDLGLSALFSETLRTAAAACSTTGNSPTPSPAPVTSLLECQALATTEVPAVSQLCCKNRACGTAPISKCSSACAEVFVPFFTQCGAFEYPAENMANLAALAQTCTDRYPGTGGGH